MHHASRLGLFMVALLTTGGASLNAQSADPPARRSMRAVRIQGERPAIDGRLDDPAWRYAPVARDFVGFEPAEGAPPSQETEALVLYDDEAIYVAFRALDAHPDSIVGRLTRRDVESTSDAVLVLIDSYHDRYVLGRMDQTTLGITLRAEAALTPTLTVQYYGQPFMSAGTFDRFRRVAAPRAPTPEERFARVAAVRSGDGYEVDLNADGLAERFDDPDFNVRQFRSNAVLRWEYRPGSTLFLVWAQARNHEAPGTRFRASDGLDALFSSAPENVLMLEVTYWLAP